MEQESPPVKAWLEKDGNRHSIDARHASRYSLWVRFKNGHVFTDGTEFGKIIFQIGDDELQIGPCRLLAEPNIEGFAGRLVPIEDFHDFEALLFRNRVEKLSTTLVNLPLLKAHKDEIKPKFREFTSNLTYDLSIYKTLLYKLESEYGEEPEQVRCIVEETIIKTVGRELMNYLDDRLADLGKIVAKFSKSEHATHGFFFRKQLWNIILESAFMARTNLKPRGYAGDSEMMRMIYRDTYEGDSLFAKVLHKHPIEQPGAQAVRNRRSMIADIIHGIQKSRGRKRIKILSVACGPAFELNDVLVSRKDCNQLSITLFDQDQYALMEAAKEIDAIERRLSARVDVTYLRESVRTMLFASELSEKWGQFDFVYSMGLFDYLTPPVARATVKKLLQLTVPGGEIAVGNFHISNPSRYYMEYWLDWAIVYRNEHDMLDFVADEAVTDPRVVFDESGVQMILRAGKEST